jgi:hypothetical protein
MRTRSEALAILVAGLVTLTAPPALRAQTDFYHLDKDRPLRVEDAYAAKRHAFELKLSPLTLSQDRDGTVQYRPSVELKHGVLPGVDLSAGLKLGVDRPHPGGPMRSDTELELSSLLNLTTETRWLPALGLRVTGHIPLEGEHGSSVELRGLATRSLGGPVRAHVNGGWSLGADPAERWWAGVALDYVLPFRHTLLLAETYVAEGPGALPGDPEGADGRTHRLHSTAGFRYQVAPALALDAGAGRSWTGSQGQDWLLTLGLTWEFGVRALMPGATPRAPAAAPPVSSPSPIERVYHPIYLPAEHNWAFRERYPALDRLFAAFDFGHGILYETLWARPHAPVSLLEEEIYERLTRDILRNPPRMHMPEASFMPRYARLVPLAREMFEWAHILHRQAYDVLADERIVDKDAAMEELLDYYLSNPLAFTDVPKGMEIMDEQYFSQEFRQRYPRFNGLIWAYHWLQVAVHEPLLLYETAEEQQAAMTALHARFWQMLEDPPSKLPSEMPMTPAIAPIFTQRYPRFAAIFDNLHMMHDVISDILVSDRVADKRAEIYRQANLFRDPGPMATTREEWIAMALAHGLDAQGGPAVGILPAAPTAGAMPGEHQHHGHTPAAADPEPHDPAAHEHEAHEPEAHEHDAHRHGPGMGAADPGRRGVIELVVRLLDDPEVRERIHAVHALHEGWEDPVVQRHLAMMRRMHAQGAGMGHAEHAHGEMAAGGRPREFILALLDDPEVHLRIHADHALHRLWEDPDVQTHIEQMRRMGAAAPES